MRPLPPTVTRALEALLAAAAGAALGFAAGWPGGRAAAVAVALAAGANGALGGLRQVYAWRTARGWLAFAADSTWGLAGTTLGTALNLVNLARRSSGFRADLSRRRNRHWHDRGARLKRGYAFTLGNVVSNASVDREGIDEAHRQTIDRHESLHIWQNRVFGPLYPAVYAVWAALGLMVGLATWAGRRGRPGLWRLVETAAYYDNPFEYWAYRHTGCWEGNRADPVLKWRRPRRPKGRS